MKQLACMTIHPTLLSVFLWFWVSPALTLVLVFYENHDTGLLYDQDSARYRTCRNLFIAIHNED